ncbi:hypothetical protein DM860_005514 [Cuscuta australis]|uniref:Uncharacterized protein n=1 Tax=Cuscuta australis TaxID=267555 RepID=A0A328E3B5_9ASTE|nr:hypothetical protein DM860_005514 [Cuscuta australis]
MSEQFTASAARGGSTSSEDDRRNNPSNPLLSLLSAFLQLFKPPQPKSAPVADEAQPGNPKPEVAEDKEKPSVVKFPRAELPSLKLESHESETDTKPAVLWQVYAIGGYLVLKWAWTRWNERNLKKKPSNEETSPPAQEEQS